MSSPNPANVASSSNTPNNPPPPGDSFQPTVRVMRLYKPGFHLSQGVPVLPVSPEQESVNHPPSSFDGLVHGNEFNLANFLLLPDSFGDIYLGEKFSAYIAIVNGFLQVPFYNVTLSIRLQTTSTVIDLPDMMPNLQKNQQMNINTTNASAITFPILSYNESADVIVQHVLNELGTHTLRVSVQYSLLPGQVNEMKTLRKFYRFNVLQPLIVLSSFREVNHKPMIQCQVTNQTKSPIFIEDMSFIPLNKNAELVQLSCDSTAKLSNPNESLNASDVLLLQPEESFAFAFKCLNYNQQLVGRIAGYPMIKWCNTMGEASFFRGDDTLIKNTLTPTGLLPQPIKFLLLKAPSKVKVYEEFEIVLRLYNTTSYAWPIRLDCPNYINTIHSHNAITQHISDDLIYDPFSSSTTISSATATAPSMNTMITKSSLVFTGITSTDLGSLDSNEFNDITLTLIGSSEGLFDIPPVCAIHSLTKEKYSSNSLGKVLVLDDIVSNALESA